MTDFDIDADPDSRPYFEGLAEGLLMIQRCEPCGLQQFPPRAICTRCGSRELRFEPASGYGIIYAMSVMHRPSEPAFAESTPYVVALVDLDEGVRVMARGAVAPEKLRTGMQVLVQPDRMPPLHPTLVFRPIEDFR